MDPLHALYVVQATMARLSSNFCKFTFVVPSPLTIIAKWQKSPSVILLPVFLFFAFQPVNFLQRIILMIVNIEGISGFEYNVHNLRMNAVNLWGSAPNLARGRGPLDPISC
jgi:hypothetical protein